MKLLVTGGAGFIGSAFVRLVLRERAGVEITNLDALTYAGNLENLAPVAGHASYGFYRGDIADADAVESVFSYAKPDAVVHFAAESHVDRSILGPDAFVRTNVVGTFTLLQAARRHNIKRFIHVSTDEVYGSIPEPHDATEEYPLKASSPYSASKAGSDLLALSYAHTYKMPVIVTRASNNYGPYQFPEKLIPLMISNAIEGKQLPIYGDGLQVRDWLHVDDHCRAILGLLDAGRTGEIYNIGGSRSLPNVAVVKMILKATGQPESLMTTVTDRPGHDRRYALSSAKIEAETGWRPHVPFEQGLAQTIEWYRTNREWVARVKSGEYKTYYERNYTGR